MSEYFKSPKLKRIAIFVVIVWAVLQLALAVYFYGAQQLSDPGHYINIANRTMSVSNWYPNQSSVYTFYIWNPGMINYLIAQINLLGSVNYNSFFNIAMNLGLVGMLYFLGKTYFDKNVGYAAAILYCITYSNLFVPLSAGTEVPFLFLALGAFCLAHFRRLDLVFLAGLVFALGNWVRPFVLIFIAPLIILFIIQRRSILTYVLFFSAYAALTFTIGKISEKECGYFVTQSTTTGANLIQTANDKAYGGVATTIFNDKSSPAYIKDKSHLTFKERDAFLKKEAIKWIKENPERYAFLYFKKIFGLFSEDSWADRPLLGEDAFMDMYFVREEISTSEFAAEVGTRLLKSTVYYAICILFFYTIIKRWRSLISARALLLLILFLGVGITCLFSVSPRYHYPFFFVMVLFAAQSIVHWISKYYWKKAREIPQNPELLKD